MLSPFNPNDRDRDAVVDTKVVNQPAPTVIKKATNPDTNGDGIISAAESSIAREYYTEAEISRAAIVSKEYYTDTDENPVRVKPEQVISSTPSASNVNAQKPTIGLSTPPKFKYADHLYIYSQIKMFNKGSYISALFNIAKRSKLLPYVDPLGRLTQAEATTVVEWLTSNGYIKSFDLNMSI